MAARRILVVDDNLDGARTLAAFLRFEGHEVELATNGIDALDTARTFLPEVVLLDIGLPGLDGYEVCRRLKREPGLEAAHVIAITGYGADDARARSHAAGFALHLAKPVNLRELASILDSFSSG